MCRQRGAFAQLPMFAVRIELPCYIAREQAQETAAS